MRELFYEGFCEELNLCMYVCMYVYVCIYVYMYLCMYVYMYVCIYVCIYMCVYVYMYVRMYASRYKMYMKHETIYNFSIRARKGLQFPYRRILQKEMNRIAPILSFVKGKLKI